MARYSLIATHAHSEWLETAAETGWLGLVFFLVAWAPTAWRAMLSRGETVEVAALGAAAALTAQGLFDNVLALPWLRLVYASALGLACPAPPPAPVSRGCWRAACVFGLVFAVWGRWAPWLGARWRVAAETAPPVAAQRLAAWSLRLLPHDARAHEARARAALRRTPPDTAMAEVALEAAREESPFNAAYPQMLAELAAGKGDCALALQRARSAYAIEPDFLEARLLEADCAARLGRRAEGVAALAELEAARARLRERQTPVNEIDRLISFLDEGRYARVRAALGRN